MGQLRESTMPVAPRARHRRWAAGGRSTPGGVCSASAWLKRRLPTCTRPPQRCIAWLRKVVEHGCHVAAKGSSPYVGVGVLGRAAMPRGSSGAGGSGSPTRGKAPSPSPSPRAAKPRSGKGAPQTHRASTGAEKRDGALYWMRVSTDTLDVLDAAFAMVEKAPDMGPVELGWKLGKKFSPKQLAAARPELDRLFGAPTVRRATAPQVTEHLQRQMAALMSAALLTRRAEAVKVQVGELEGEHAVAATAAARAKAEVRAQQGSAESKDAARRAAQQKMAAGTRLTAARQEDGSVLSSIEAHLSSCGWRSAADELISATTKVILRSCCVFY